MPTSPREIGYGDALHPSTSDGVQDEFGPIQPPEYELFAQRIVANAGRVKEYVIKAYKEAGLDPLVHSMFKAWEDVPAIVKGRVKYLMRRTASQTVADRKEVEEFLTQIIRGDPRLESHPDRKHLYAIEAVKELCKMKGYYSPVEIKNTHEIVVPDAIRRMSDEQLIALTNEAKGEVIEVEAEVKALQPAESGAKESGDGDGTDWIDGLEADA